VPEPDTREPFILNVSVTGHRSRVLTPPLVRTLRPVVYTLFRQLRDAMLRLEGSKAAFGTSTEARLRLYTPLATGADQIAAICARSSGFFVSALLPFEPHEYRNDFEPGEEVDEFERALEAVDEIVALPGDRSDPVGAYVRVAKSLVAEANVLVAIWDGEPGRGPGGTGHVVELALQSSIPVIHIDIDRGSDEVWMRAITAGEATPPIAADLQHSDFYGGLLRNALRLDRTAVSDFNPVVGPGIGRRRESGSPA
jgi:hypothetical protein